MSSSFHSGLYSPRDVSYWADPGPLFQRIQDVQNHPVRHLQGASAPPSGEADRFCVVSIGWTDLCDVAYAHPAREAQTGLTALLARLESLADTLRSRYRVTPILVFAHCAPYWAAPGGSLWDPRDSEKITVRPPSEVSATLAAFLAGWDARCAGRPGFFRFCGERPPADRSGHLGPDDVEAMGRRALAAVLLNVALRRLEEAALPSP